MAQMTVRIDDNLKVQAEMLFAEIGMPLSTAVTIFLKQAVRSHGRQQKARASEDIRA